MVGIELVLIAQLATSGCSVQEIRSGTCSAVIPGGVEIIGDQTTPGIGGPAEPAPPPYMLPDGHCNRVAYPLCHDTYEVTGPVRVIDIAAFHAAPGVASMDPDGWALVGRPVTVRAAASTHDVAGTLLDRPAVVRFTPSAFRWDFGDGTTAISTPDVPRATHDYRESGRVAVGLTVEYSALYRWADAPDWVPVLGTVVVPSGTMPVLVREVTTVLVPGDCARDPDGPGC